MIYKGIDYSYCWLQLELTDYCNYKCDFCLSGNPLPQTHLTTPHLIWQENKIHSLTFKLPDRGYREVHLIGDFNYWGILPEGILTRPRIKNTHLQLKNGSWQKELTLKTGKYRFAFLTLDREGNWNWAISPYYEEAKDKYLKLPTNYIEAGTPGNLQRGFIEEKLVEKILKELSSRKIEMAEIAPFWFGESLLHPDFKNILSEIGTSRIFRRLSLHTNASLLTPEITDFIISLYPHFPEGIKISFSLDSIQKDTYPEIRKGGTLQNTLSHLFYFLKKSSRFPKILSIIQFIVQEKNFEEGETFYHFWKEWLKKKGISFKTYFSFSYDQEIGNTSVIIFFRALDYTSTTRENYNQLHEKLKNIILSEKKELLIEQENKSKNIEGKNTTTSPKYICSSPWRSLFVQWNGDVTVCCADTLGNLSVGNFWTDNLDTIWHEGEKIKKLREAHLKHDFTENFYRCAFCPQWQVPALTEHEKKVYFEYLKNG